MDEKKDRSESDSLSGIARNVEAKLTETLLRWRYKRQGKNPPADDQLKDQSRAITVQVNEILVRSGKNIWKELRSRTEKK